MQQGNEGDDLVRSSYCTSGAEMPGELEGALWEVVTAEEGSEEEMVRGVFHEKNEADLVMKFHLDRGRLCTLRRRKETESFT